MLQISIRALLIMAALGWLTFTRQLPTWVLLLVLLYNVPGTFRCWLPWQKRKYLKKINELIAQQQAGVAAEFKALKPTEIN